MRSEPIFITGVQRSGTTLLSAMLAAHSRMSCGPETHFFQRLVHEDEGFLTDPTNWPVAGIQFVSSISYTNFVENTAERTTILEKYQLSREEIAAYLSQNEPGIAPLLASVVEHYMRKQGKSRWVEKTPDHIQYLGLIRTHFPSSPVIRIVRDPRDVALSLTKVPWGAKTYFEAIEYWKTLDEAGRVFFETDSYCYTLKYEDLIRAPEVELRRLCDFIGEDFEESMLDTSTTGKQVNSRNVPWKDKAAQPVDHSRIAVWNQEISPAMNAYTEAVIGERMLAYGYPLSGEYPTFAEVFPVGSHFYPYAEPLMQVASSGVRFWKTDPNETPSGTVILGDPILSKRKSAQPLARLSAIVSVWRDTRMAANRKRKLYWVLASQPENFGGIGNSLLRNFLAPYKIQP